MEQNNKYPFFFRRRNNRVPPEAVFTINSITFDQFSLSLSGSFDWAFSLFLLCLSLSWKSWSSFHFSPHPLSFSPPHRASQQANPRNILDFRPSTSETLTHPCFSFNAPGSSRREWTEKEFTDTISILTGLDGTCGSTGLTPTLAIPRQPIG